jgi:apolipoprotein N-acyltransferase
MVQSLTDTFIEKIMSMWRLALSVVAGVLHGFSIAWPAFALGDVLGVTGQSSGLLQCFSLGILAAILLQVASQEAQPTSFIASHQVQSKTKRQGQSVWRQGALIGAVFATSAMAATWGWLYVSMHRYGGLPSWLAWPCCCWPRACRFILRQQVAFGWPCFAGLFCRPE